MSRYSYSQQVGPGRRVTASIVPIRYSSSGPDGVVDGFVDLTPSRIVNQTIDGWITTQGDFNYALGQPGPNYPGSGVFDGVDGVFGFGARQGQNWLTWRLSEFLILHWPTRTRLVLDDSPNYDRSNLTSAPITRNIQGTDVNLGFRARWDNVFTTPGGGSVDVEWIAYGDRIKENIHVSQTAREWVEANRGLSWARTQLEIELGESPGDRDGEPAANFYFGHGLVMDWGDVPRRIRDGVLLAPDADFENDLPVWAEDSADRVMYSLPLGFIGVVSPSNPDKRVNGQNYRQPLRQRFWNLAGVDVMAVGIDFVTYAQLEPGPLIFDPQVSDAFTQHGEQENPSTWHESGFGGGGTNYQTESGSENNALRADVSGESIPADSTVSSAQWQHDGDTESSGATDVNIRVSDSASSTALSGSRLPNSETPIGSAETWQIPTGTSEQTSGDSGNMAAALEALFGSAAWPGQENIVVWLDGAGGGNYVSSVDNTANIDFFYTAPVGGFWPLTHRAQARRNTLLRM